MPFYRDADRQVCQGDVFDEVPSVHVREGIAGALREVTLPKRAKGFALRPLDVADEKTGRIPDFRSEGELAPIRCQIGRAVLLSYDCDIEHEKKHLLVALVRSFTAVPEPDRQIIRNNENSNFFYLPEEPRFGIPESYVDLRRITCVHPGVLATCRRLASLTPQSVAALQAQLFLFITRREITIPIAGDEIEDATQQ